LICILRPLLLLDQCQQSAPTSKRNAYFLCLSRSLDHLEMVSLRLLGRSKGFGDKACRRSEEGTPYHRGIGKSILKAAIERIARRIMDDTYLVHVVGVIDSLPDETWRWNIHELIVV
jgi:hypothetical protein